MDRKRETERKIHTERGGERDADRQKKKKKEKMVLIQSQRQRHTEGKMGRRESSTLSLCRVLGGTACL